MSSHLDFGMESRGREVLGVQGQIHRPAQSHLVDRCRAYRLFDLADLEHRRDQIAAGRLSLHDRSAVSARGAARADRLAHAISLHVRGHDIRRPQLDDLQRVGAVHSDDRARVFRDAARHAVLANAVGVGDWPGLGGGNFASSMANISFFYPDRMKGWALGLNAAGGNIGVSSVQLLTPILMGLGIVNLYQGTPGPGGIYLAERRPDVAPAAGDRGARRRSSS